MTKTLPQMEPMNNQRRKDWRKMIHLFSGLGLYLGFGFLGFSLGFGF